MTTKKPLPYDTTQSYMKVVEFVKKQANAPMLEPEAHEAARNLITFCRTLLAMNAELSKNRRYAKRD